jgi:hypothetical protein
MSNLTIPHEVADGIAVACMQDQLKYLIEETRAHVEDGKYLHPEDYYNNTVKYIPALKLLIDYFGGTAND